MISQVFSWRSILKKTCPNTEFAKKTVVHRQSVGNGMMTKKINHHYRWNALSVVIKRLISMEKPVKEVNGIIAQFADKVSPKLLILYYYRRQVEPEKIRMVLQAHSEGSSLRGVSRTTKLAYNTVVSLVRRASVKGQMVHNKEVKQIETEQLAGDEFWSFVQKNKNTQSQMN